VNITQFLIVLFYNLALSYKRVSLFNVMFQIHQRLYPIEFWGKDVLADTSAAISKPGGVEGLKSAAT